jgi:hypothetical protein
VADEMKRMPKKSQQDLDWLAFKHRRQSWFESSAHGFWQTLSFQYGERDWNFAKAKQISKQVISIESDLC